MAVLAWVQAGGHPTGACVNEKPLDLHAVRNLSEAGSHQYQPPRIWRSDEPL